MTRDRGLLVAVTIGISGGIDEGVEHSIGVGLLAGVVTAVGVFFLIRLAAGGWTAAS